MSEISGKINMLKDLIDKGCRLIKIDQMKAEVEQLEIKMAEDGFWQDREKSKLISSQCSDLKAEITKWQLIAQEASDLLELANMEDFESDDKIAKEMLSKYEELEKKYQEFELILLLSGEYDKSSAIISIHAGTGGTDAQDWAQMLERMFLRYCEKKGFKTDILSREMGNEAGVKSVDIEVQGLYAYGYLQSEAGVHRLVRISPFDAEKMRHTSFALVEVLPVIEGIKEVTVKSDDLKIDVYRAGGHGGQGVNTTDSAVRITHKPTGIVVTCQNERSQHQNKDQALKHLKAKLFKYYQAKEEQEKELIKGRFSAAVWGNQVRSYVIHPYKMVKDHRTGYETQDTEGVLDGDLESFVEAYLRSKVAKLSLV